MHAVRQHTQQRRRGSFDGEEQLARGRVDGVGFVAPFLENGPGVGVAHEVDEGGYVGCAFFDGVAEDADCFGEVIKCEER